MTSPRRIAVVGAGPAGTALALGLVRHGYDVTLVSDRTAEEIRDGSVMSSQITFESALESESALGIARLLPSSPPIEQMTYETTRLDGSTAAFATRLATPARSLDQRVRVPLLMEEIEHRGGKVVVRSATVEDLEDLARDHDLVVVSTGRGGLTSLFERDADRSPYDAPQRVAALTYLHGMAPAPEGPGLRYHSVEGVGECFTCPALTVDGPCDIVVVEGVPGGPLDRWDDVTSPAEHLAVLRSALADHFPSEAARLADATLVDDGSVLRGRITPAVRRPVGALPSGAPVLGMADVVVLNDPLTSQGSNNAIKSASFYLEAIAAPRGRVRRGLDAAHVRQLLARLGAVGHRVDELLAAPGRPAPALGRRRRGPAPGDRGAGRRRLRRRAAVHPWWFDAEAAASFVAATVRAEGARFDVRDLRRALGQYATGVTVVTTTDSAGERFGMTANSFTSVSLDPPLVLWAAGRDSPSLAAFEASERFAVNVLASDQHHLSRQFSTSGSDKFDGVRLLPGDPPLLEGTVARFVCRRLPGDRGRVEAGDHVLFLGEIESYDAAGGEPLVFHSGFYRLATKHPDL